MQFPGYPDPDFIQMTKEAFPEKGIANVEEARVSHYLHYSSAATCVAD
jgi:hypothetical protein